MAIGEDHVEIGTGSGQDQRLCGLQQVFSTLDGARRGLFLNIFSSRPSQLTQRRRKVHKLVRVMTSRIPLDHGAATGTVARWEMMSNRGPASAVETLSLRHGNLHPPERLIFLCIPPVPVRHGVPF